MNLEVTIREYGCLGLTDVDLSLNYAKIDEATWEWLKELCLSRIKGQNEFLRLVSRHGQECLQVRNYIGVLESPAGTQIEILPKTTENDSQSISATRTLLWKMLATVNDISWIESEEAHLQTTSRPIFEVLIEKYLQEVSALAKRGIRNDYVRIAETQNFLRGRINVSKQLRQLPTQQHKFNIEYDKYVSDRAENRLIRLALERALRWSKSFKNQRVARELLFLFDAIPPSSNIQKDFSDWRNTREMVYYQPSKPWCQLILNEQSPFFSSGRWQGVSLLFPMEQLFEKYVGKKLNAQLDGQYRLSEQGGGQHLVSHSGENWFALRPDFIVRENKAIKYVLDTKWKLINSGLSSGKDKYLISQSDMYQLFAYGMKYLDGRGELFLIFPLHPLFTDPLPPFDYSSELRLWVVPFNLDSDELVLHKQCQLKSFTKSVAHKLTA